MHVPFHDHAAVDCIVRVAEQCGVDELVLNGDIFDFYSVSSHEKSPTRRAILADELEVGREIVRLFDSTPPRKKTLIGGNHENRLDRYVSRTAPELTGLVPGIRSLLALDDCASRWETRDYNEPYTVGDVTFLHDVGASGTACARRSQATLGGKLVFGHAHRLQIHHEDAGWAACTGWSGNYSELGYFSEHLARKVWTHGFGIVDFVNGRGEISLHPIVNGKAIVDGSEV